MEVGETNSHDGLNDVSLQQETACTVESKALEENGGDLAFPSTFSPETQVDSQLAALAGVKRKHAYQTDDQDNKHIHLDQEAAASDGFADLTTLVNMSSAVSLAVSQEVNSQTFSNTAIDSSGQIAALSQEPTNGSLSLSEAVAALATGHLQSQETTIIPTSQPVVMSDNNNSVNQAWFTTKEDKDNLHGKGVKWRQGMWSKEENDQLKENILEYCQINSIPDPNIIIFEMTKDDRKDFYRTIAKGIRRPLFAIYRRVLRMYDRKNYVGKYSSEEVQQLKALKEKHGNDWATIGAAMGRSASSVKDRFRLMRDHCRSGKWTAEEEQKLSNAVHELSSTRSGDLITTGISWAAVAEQVGTRSEKQCRSKWLNYLNWKEKGGQEWTKQDEINLITSVRSPQWLRSKWWALKKHVPEMEATSFEAIYSYLYESYTATLQNKIDRQEARFKGNHLPSVSAVIPAGRSVHINPISTGAVTNSGICHTITVSSDGSVTRDDTSPLPTGHSRFEVVQVNAIPTQDIFNSQSSVQGAPSYIIQAPAGQTYIIQQPTGSLVRQTHSAELATTSEGIGGQHQQEVVMTTAVLQTHHAVQTLPEVSPEFTQAIVQTDISGPITASDLTHTVIDKTQTGLPQNEIEQEDEPSSVEQTSVANSTLDGSHGGLTTELQVEGVGDKEVQAVKQTGPAAIAQTLDGKHLTETPAAHMHQVSSQNRDVVVSPDPLEDVHVTVISNMETSLAATLSPSSGISISQQHGISAANNPSDLSVSAMVPQVTLPDEILQSQSDEHGDLSPTETTSVMMVSENPMTVTSTLPSQILQPQTEDNTNSSHPSRSAGSTVSSNLNVSVALANIVADTGGLEHSDNWLDS